MPIVHDRHAEDKAVAHTHGSPPPGHRSTFGVCDLHAAWMVTGKVMCFFRIRSERPVGKVAYV